MSIAGSLEHARAVDIVHFIYIGRRTGTLRIRAPSREARISFHKGCISNAWLTGSPRLGELVVLAGLVPPAELNEVLAAQTREARARPLGQMLVSDGLVTDADLRQLLTEEFGRRVQEIVAWTRGDFEFVADELWPLEELGPDADGNAVVLEIDTQTVLLEAVGQVEQLRRLEEDATTVDENPLEEFAKDRTPVATYGEPPPKRSSQTLPDSPTLALLTAAGGGDAVALAEANPAAFPRVQVVTRDAGLPERLTLLLRRERARVSLVAPRDAGFSLPGEPPPIVVLDLRGSTSAADPVRSLRRTRPKASVVAYCSPTTTPAPIYDAGAAAMVHGDEQALSACVRSLFRTRLEQSSETRIQEALRDGFVRLRRVVSDLRSGVLGTTVGLSLLNVMADSLERAILFVIEADQLVPVGSFGLVSSGKQLAGLLPRLYLSLRDPSVFVECAESDRPRVATYDAATLPAHFRSVVAAPWTTKFAVFPIAGSQRVIAMIYADNGNKPTPIADVQLVGLALSQLGLALENEFLRRPKDAPDPARAP